MPTPRDLDALVADLTLDEKARLTVGRDSWSTAPVERAGIPAVRMTDGPNGARGSSVLGAGDATAVCVPCGSALGATWDPELLERVGALLGEEARTKGCRILLAPTVNLHRSPLAGRNFECFSEDPLLSGLAAAAYVRGVQSRDVAVTVKHLVANEAETERYTMSSVVDERALRELYLLPFELAVREGGALGVMTSYNRLNGRWCAEDEELLAGVLRGDVGFGGFVVSDWYAAVSTTASPRAGLDLEMPGPPRAFGPALADAVRAGDVPEALLDAQVRRLLGVLHRVGALDEDADALEERSVDRPEHRALAREAATEGLVLLQNDGLLPLDADALRSVAVLGPNADRAQIMGGGSAKLRPHYRVTPLEALRAALGEGVDVRFERGVDIDVRTPPLRGGPGFDVELFAGAEPSGEPVARRRREDGLLLWSDAPAPGLAEDDWCFRASTTYRPAETGTHRVTLVQAGRARVWVDGALVLDGVSDPPPRGDEWFGTGSVEVGAEVELEAGRAVEVVVECAARGASGVARGAKVGVREPAPPDLLDRAVAAAAAPDLAVVVVGTNDDWETEGEDRASLALPGGQDELVERVLAAQPRTVVVVNAGAPVTMDWAERAPALLQAWFGGQEAGGALADVLLGRAEPGGRLPTTLPLRVEHTPAFGNFPGENSEVRYGEGLLVGYRWYDTRRLPVRFAFGHGLSYTSFALGAPRLSSSSFAPGDALRVEVDVTNTGARRGAEVVQLYVAPLAPRLVRPAQELKAFAKVRLDPGETTTVSFALGDRAFAAWDPGDPERPALRERLRGSPLSHLAERPLRGGWVVDPGPFELRVGRASDDVAHVAPVAVEG